MQLIYTPPERNEKVKVFFHGILKGFFVLQIIYIDYRNDATQGGVDKEIRQKTMQESMDFF